MSRRGGSFTHITGLDWLRVAAMILVTVQHAGAVMGYYERLQWFNLSPGQSGVAIFCAISGFLAFAYIPSSPLAWLGKKLLKIYPAYWVATLAAFALVVVFGGKPFSLELFISQMLGTGFFTHGWNLINVVSWFISLILLCYVLTTVSMTLPRPEWCMAIIAVICIVCLVAKLEVDLSRHVLAFTLGALLARYRFAGAGVLVGLAFIIVGQLTTFQLCYGGIGLLCLSISLYSFPSSKWVANLSAYCYEYFLVHGIFMVGFVQKLGNKAWVMAAAIVASMLGAVSLKYFIQIISFALKSLRQLRAG